MYNKLNKYVGDLSLCEKKKKIKMIKTDKREMKNKLK